jgi:hypothetical protein
MTWKSITEDEAALCRQMRLWIETVRDTGAKLGLTHYGSDWLPGDPDWHKSALFERIRSGLQPLGEPPPVGLACPWYAVVEDAGPHYVFDVQIEPEWYGENTVVALSNPYTIYERLGDKDFIVGDRSGTSYRFRLWFDPDWRHPQSPDNPRFQGGWFLQNVVFSPGISTPIEKL